MKKILFFLITVVYVLLTIFCGELYQYHEEYNIFLHNKTGVVYVDNYENAYVDDIPTTVDKISSEENVNIYLYNYLENNNETDVTIYALVNNQDEFYSNFNLKWGEVTELSSDNKFISSDNTGDPNQVGQLDLFDPHYTVTILPMSSMDKNINPYSSEYYIETPDNEVLNQTLERFSSEINIDFQPVSDSVEYINFNFPINILFCFTILLVILITVCITYFILLRYKEFAVKKMFGASNMQLIFLSLYKDYFKISAYALIFALLIQTVILIFYNNLSDLISFYFFMFFFLFICTIGMLIIYFIPSLFIMKIEIHLMLKNKKPLKLLQSLHIFTKFIVSSVLILCAVNIGLNLNNLLLQSKNNQIWSTTQNYAYYVYGIGPYNMDDPDQRYIRGYDNGQKSQKLFKLENQNAIFCEPSQGIEFKIPIEEEGDTDHSPFDPDYGNHISINANYLNINPIYDTDGNPVHVDSEYGDYMILLVPEKFKPYEQEIVDMYADWATFQRYEDIDIHNQYLGLPEEKHENEKVEIIYIQDGQSCFLYNPDFNPEFGNYATDCIISIINSENSGADQYAHYFSGGYFMPYISDPQNPYKCLSDDINTVGLENIVESTPLTYTRVDKFMFDLETNTAITLVLLSILIIIEAIVTSFTVLNYMEQRKNINMLFKINGLTFAVRHRWFIYLNFLFWFAIGIVTCFMLQKYFVLIYSYILVFTLTELLFSIILIKKYENNKSIDVLKGA